MWPFKTKKQKQQEMWDILSNKPDPNAMEKMLESIYDGDSEKTERLFKQIIDNKMREYEKILNKN